MGKNDKDQTEKKAHKAICKDGESKHKNKPSFDAATFEATDAEGLRHSHWRDQFRQLCEYKVQFGHYHVPNKYAANPKLGLWAATQRCKYKLYQEGKPSPMTAERIRALESVGFGWGKTTALWSEQFKQLCQYKAQFGHCDVPYKYAANPKLGLWVAKQRSNYKTHQKGKPSPMTVERIRALEGVGFAWGLFILLGTNSFNNCVNTMFSLATASCHKSILPTPSSVGGFRISASTIDLIRKESQAV